MFDLVFALASVDPPSFAVGLVWLFAVGIGCVSWIRLCSGLSASSEAVASLEVVECRS